MDELDPGRDERLQPPAAPESQWAVPGVQRPRPPAEAHPDVVAVAAAVEVALGVDLTGLEDRTLVETAALAMVAAQQAQLLALRAVAQVQETDATSSLGYARARTWLDALPVPLDRTALTVARSLGDWPQVDDAVAHGRISLSAARTLQVALRRLTPHLDRADGRINGRDGETVLAHVLTRGITMLLTQAVGGFPTTTDRRLLDLLAAVDEIAARPAGQLDRVEAGFVLLARHLPPGQALTEAVSTLVDALLPDEHDRRVRQQRERRGVRLRKNDDGSGWTLNGRLDLETGEKLWLILQTEVQRDPQSSQDTDLAAALRQREQARREGRTAPTGQPVPADQPGANGQPGAHGRPGASARPGASEQPSPTGDRRGDAASGRGNTQDSRPGTLANSALADSAVADSAERSGEEPAGLVDPFAALGATGSWDTEATPQQPVDTGMLPRTSPEKIHDALANALDRYLSADLVGTRHKQPVRITVTVGLDTLGDQPGALPAVTGSGLRLPRHLLHAWVCDSSLTRQVLDLRGKVIATSHSQRTITAAERNALHTETGGVCQVSGCYHRASDLGPPLVPHHVTAWSRSGTTSLRDTAMICEPCHHDLHSGGHTLTLKDGRRFNEDGWSS